MMKKTYLTIIVLVLVISFIFGAVCYRPNINTATIEELTEIRGIGEVLSNRISLYLDTNKNATFEDIEDIDGIGEYRIELLKQKWSD